MNFTKFPSCRKDGSLIQLSDFLCTIPESTNWIWSVIDFYGTGIAPNSLTMTDFENLVRSSPVGFIMNGYELKEFANSLIQTYDCLIIGARSQEYISGDKTVPESFNKSEIIIEGVDSTEWLVWTHDAVLMQMIEIGISIEKRT